MSNLNFTLKQGEVGKVIRFTLSDADGAVDLTNYTVTMTLKKGSAAAVVDEASVTKETQSGATLGKCHHTFDATTADLTPGIYKGELKLTSGSNVLYWPVDEKEKRTYFTVEVQKPLS
jgi:hypothetical protein